MDAREDDTEKHDGLTLLDEYLIENINYTNPGFLERYYQYISKKNQENQSKPDEQNAKANTNQANQDKHNFNLLSSLYTHTIPSSPAIPDVKDTLEKKERKDIKLEIKADEISLDNQVSHQQNFSQIIINKMLKIDIKTLGNNQIEDLKKILSTIEHEFTEIRKTFKQKKTERAKLLEKFLNNMELKPVNIMTYIDSSCDLLDQNHKNEMLTLIYEHFMIMGRPFIRAHEEFQSVNGPCIEQANHLSEQKKNELEELRAKEKAEYEIIRKYFKKWNQLITEKEWDKIHDNPRINEIVTYVACLKNILNLLKYIYATTNSAVEALRDQKTRKDQAISSVATTTNNNSVTTNNPFMKN